MILFEDWLRYWLTCWVFVGMSETALVMARARLDPPVSLGHADQNATVLNHESCRAKYIPDPNNFEIFTYIDCLGTMTLNELLGGNTKSGRKGCDLQSMSKRQCAGCVTTVCLEREKVVSSESNLAKWR